MRFTAFILVFVVCFSAINASSEMRLLEGYVFDHKTQRTIDNVDIILHDDAVGTTTMNGAVLSCVCGRVFIACLFSCRGMDW